MAEETEALDLNTVQDAVLTLVDHYDLIPTQKIFLATYATMGSLTQAMAAAGISRRQYNSWLSDLNSEFPEALLDAKETFCDSLESLALLGAKQGSERLLLKLLEANRPEKYGNKVDVAVSHTWADMMENARQEGLIKE